MKFVSKDTQKKDFVTTEKRRKFAQKKKEKMVTAKLYLKPKKEESLKRFHPWVFSGAIQKISGTPAEGDLIEIFDCNGNYCAVGHYQIGSIAVRILSFEEKEINTSFWKEKISNAYQLRLSLGLLREDNNSFRLIHGEGDGLPGLIVDIYGDTAVMQAHSVGMHTIRMEIAEAIINVFHGKIKNVFYKSESTLPYKANIAVEDGYLIGECSGDCIAKENGLLFHVDWLKGQKTGFFIDQRENRTLLEKYSKNRNVLNMFCYTGGFSFYAMRGEALRVDSVDSSSKAIELTNRNVELNFPNDTRHKAYATDAFKFLDDIKKDEYDLIILDPPAFAKHRDVQKDQLYFAQCGPGYITGFVIRTKNGKFVVDFRHRRPTDPDVGSYAVDINKTDLVPVEGKWNKIKLTYDTTKITLTVNGKSQSFARSGMAQWLTLSTFGGTDPGRNKALFFKGLLRKLTITHRALAD